MLENDPRSAEEKSMDFQKFCVMAIISLPVFLGLDSRVNPQWLVILVRAMAIISGYSIGNFVVNELRKIRRR